MDPNGQYMILLADDDPDDRDLFEEAALFINPRVSIRTVRDGVELMEDLAQETANLSVIFLDLNMPKKNGKECLAEIKTHPSLRNIPVIIYTTSLNPADIDDTYRDGAFHFFKKPNSFNELKSILQKAFDSLSRQTRPSRDTYVLNENASYSA